jgi:A/G-specific adenine glycosylase
VPESALHGPVLSWFAEHGRDLPWRRPDATPWGVLVSEFMLQQTPVARVEPVWKVWMDRWPAPPDLAAEPAGEAIRAWGRLGYPRRALRLHEAAVMISRDHGGRLPSDRDRLRELPGVGEYTAAAVASFAFGQRHAVLDTNVRRVFARAVAGTQYPAAHLTNAERTDAERLLPDDGTAATWAVASMELGALVCTARAPRCGACPISAACAWSRAGRPEHAGPARRGQAYVGTDRYVRGLLLAVLRGSDEPVAGSHLAAVVPDRLLRDPHQRDRCLDALVNDGLVEPLAHNHFRLPS